MLWIALYLPQLPLQLVQRAHAGRGWPARQEQHKQQKQNAPCVIAVGPDTCPVICCADAAARARGILPGMPVASARVLADDLEVLPRHETAESEALHNLACWAGQFTPNVVVQAGQGLLLEVASTLRLHGGLTQLMARVRRGLVELGYQAAPGVAPTPMAAWMFAQAREAGLRVRMCKDPALLAERLKPLPLALLDWPDEVVSPLQALGIRTIGQCLALPRAGFTRRFGRERRLDLDKVLGDASDPRPWFTPPETFDSRMEFGFEVDDALALLFPLKRLLGELEGFLRGRGAGVQQCHLLLEHLRGRTRITVGTATPERHADRLLGLAREHLTKTSLMAPVLALGIAADQLLDFEESSQGIVPDPRSRAIGWSHLIDKLSARLGSEKLYCLRALDDHRPEHAWRRVTHSAVNVVRPSATSTLRPLWLLDPPRILSCRNGEPLCQGRLQMLTGPERIEAGWWDARVVRRDYYMARNSQGETLWIYREHDGDRPWYLHGIFA